MLRPPPSSTLFPYTTLFRSAHRRRLCADVPRDRLRQRGIAADFCGARRVPDEPGDRKSTRLNSSHVSISYAVFCLKKKKTKQYTKYRSIQPPPVCPWSLLAS